ncbi:MAG: hypothetical protein U0872_08285 [Planctomycetaceae bacterium]
MGDTLADGARPNPCDLEFPRFPSEKPPHADSPVCLLDSRWISRRYWLPCAWQILACVELLSVAAWADETFSLRPLDLVSQDVAARLRGRSAKLTWTKFRQSELFRRASRTPLYQQWKASKVHQHWREVEGGRTDWNAAVGSIIGPVRTELVLAMYLSGGQPPGRSLADACRQQRWQRPCPVVTDRQRLKPTSSLETLAHQGREYYRRKKPGPQGSALFMRS